MSFEKWVKDQPVKLPDAEFIVSKQYVGGSLFKSQNGTIWTPANLKI